MPISQVKVEEAQLPTKSEEPWKFWCREARRERRLKGKKRKVPILA
jgi:hypothetical protein